MDFVIITGLSGAGKSQAKKVFEDNQYYCIDNLPPALIADFIHLCDNNIEHIEKVALVSDVRNKQFFNELIANLDSLEKAGYDYRILFLDADNQTLINRYKETRRTHPLRPNGSIEEAIEEERDILSDLKLKADFILKTDDYNLTQLKNEINKLFIENSKQQEMNLVLKSFGYKRGIPLDADYIFDVRFLPNPYYIEELRNKTGNDASVQNYVMSFDNAKEIYNRILSVISFAAKICKENERNQLVIAIGCTGGHHRSVTFTNRIYQRLLPDYKNIVKIHRDIEK